MLSLIRLIPGQVFFSLLLLVSIYSTANYFIIKWIVAPNHLLVESELAQLELDRFSEALRRETEALDTIAHDWAAWDDTYNFVQDRNQSYISSNLLDATLIDSEFNLLYIFRSDGSLVWSRLLDLETEEEVVMEALPDSGLPRDHPLLHHADENSSVTGLIITELGPLLIASHPIVTSENQGPIVGSLMFGRLLTESLMVKLRKQTKVQCQLIDLNDQYGITGIPADISSLGPDMPSVFHHTDTTIVVYSLLDDYQGNPKWLLEVHANRIVTSHTRDILHYVLLSNSVLGFITLLIFLLLYRRQISTATATFRSLIDKSLTVQEKEREKVSTVKTFSTDELSRLSNDLRAMIESFERAKEQQQSIITEHKISRRQINDMLVKEIKERLKIEEDLRTIQVELENQVNDRTLELQRTNTTLQNEIEERKKNQKELEDHQERLRSLSSELVEMGDRERRQLATELHDQIGQSLSAIKLYVDALVSSVSDESTRENLQQIAEILDQTIQDTRTLTFELSPPVLYELGLEAALEWFVEEIQQSHPIEISIECDTFPKNTSAALLALIFRTIRELLLNIVRHAKASNGSVKVRYENSSVWLRVADNGIGMQGLDMASDEVTQGGFGLFSIRERVINIGGKIAVDSQPGEGTKITLTIPTQEDIF